MKAVSAKLVHCNTYGAGGWWQQLSIQARIRGIKPSNIFYHFLKAASAKLVHCITRGGWSQRPSIQARISLWLGPAPAALDIINYVRPAHKMLYLNKNVARNTGQWAGQNMSLLLTAALLLPPPMHALRALSSLTHHFAFFRDFAHSLKLSSELERDW